MGLASILVLPTVGFRAQASALTVSGLRTDRIFRPESDHAPVWFTGRVLGGRPGSTHRLALAVNESIATVGRSFYFRDSASERFSLLIPETVLRPGSNHAALYEVHRHALRRLKEVGPSTMILADPTTGSETKSAE